MYPFVCLYWIVCSIVSVVLCPCIHTLNVFCMEWLVCVDPVPGWGVRVINIYTGFLRCFPRMVHWVMSAEFDVNFARGLLCCNLFYHWLSGLLLMDFYLVVKFAEMDAGSGLCIEVNLARGYLYIVTSRRFRYVSCYISRQTFMLWEILRAFFFICLRVVKIFDWLLRLCWVYI